ncbi:MAG: ADP-ribosylglycohydrolase family protein [Clostridiales bacterium]|nr:ADP-ribosylglycohydrolase family protein [Clostridiales bacterium]
MVITMQNREIITDKIRGSLFGGAVGDALGYPVEFMSASGIFRRYGRDGITAYDCRRNSESALISDDTQMTLFTANGVLFAHTRGCLRGIGGTPSDYMMEFYQNWLLTQEMSYTAYQAKEQQIQLKKEKDRFFHGETMPSGRSWLMDVPQLFHTRAPGNTCMSALRMARNHEGRAGMKPPFNDSKGCGGIMRVAPIGLHYGKRPSIEELDREGAEIARITHGHSLGYMPAAVLTHILNRMVYTLPVKEGQDDTKSLKEIVTEARDTVASLFKGDQHLEELTNIINQALELSENRRDDLTNIQAIGEGWTGEEALAIAIYCSLRHADSFSDGVIAAVNHSGDSDSTGAITGNILGAWLGYHQIEDKWKEDLELSDIILEMADDLYAEDRFDSLYDLEEDRDWIRKYVDGCK